MKYQTNGYSNSLLKSSTIIILLCGMPQLSLADTTAPCNIGAGNNSTECGISRAEKNLATALGSGAVAAGTASTALSAFTNAYGEFSIAVGLDASITDNSPHGIAIGYEAFVGSAPGGIAIGGDGDGDGLAARSLAPGAIAIGADVVANKANTMTVGVPIEVKNDKGTARIIVNEKNPGNNVETLFSLICDTCTPGFRFNQVSPSNNTWFFRMLQLGNFSIDDPLTTTREAEFRSGGDLKIGGTLIQASSREIKSNITTLDNAEILDKIEQLPITQWSYNKDNGRVKHIGPMAEDFYVAFGLGDTNKGISSIDVSGVALSAIKALNAENQSIATDNKKLKAEMAALKELVTVLINKKTDPKHTNASF